nr:ABC transporter permease [Lachnospiraceae bacterium]
MQKVGMSKKEVRASIRSQIIKVFFLPLVMACIHLAMAFPMMNRLLLLFGMVNVKLFAICTVVTVAIFAVIYAIVYSITAKTYYKIVD